ncbi:LTA synthase family protein [Streptococcus sp. zg-JUN1979]|uniref:LTA synthase family protein n=1 Tax=Streptococcus sp. zg-JUN1979 TaxID=3391450 RepID=UPI0039A4E5CB
MLFRNNNFKHKRKSYRQEYSYILKTFKHQLRFKNDFMGEKKYGYILTLVKYSFALFITLLACTVNNSYIFISIIELLIVALVSNYAFRISFLFANILNSILFFLYIVEQLLMFFGGTYLTLVMLSNVESIGALSGKIPFYLLFIIPTILVLFIPITEIRVSSRSYHFILLALAFFEISSLSLRLVDSSPFYNYFKITNDKITQLSIHNRIKRSPNVTANFYHSEIKGAIDKPDNLIEKPNIILILTEGLSQEVIDDSRSIMPNISNLQKESLQFTNYYNHTFATYRGIIGQLYSGYQFENYESNSLISIQDILKNEGYHTEYINTEPANLTFSDYVKRLNFDEVTYKKGKRNGAADTLSDKEAYEFLYDEAKYYESLGEPFFITMYTFGTHATLDSPDKKFQDGKDAVLNKFYNLDFQFNKFIEKFNNSSLSSNTIIIFSSDHATYVESGYQSAFSSSPPRQNNSFGKVPFFIYHKGVFPLVVDANGRNSLDLVPTVLDYLDISVPNYFLGTSLFTQEINTEFSTIYNSELNVIQSEDNSIRWIDGNDKKEIMKQIEEYFMAQLQEPRIP